MKNRICLFLIIILSSHTVFAEGYGIRDFNIKSDSTTLRKSKKENKSKMATSFDGASQKGSFAFQPALNFGHHTGFKKVYSSFGYDYAYTGLIPGVTVNLDYNVHKYVGIGVNYSAAFQKFSKSKVFYLGNFFGARCVFHWWQLFSDKSGKSLAADKIDFDIHFHAGGYLISEKNLVTSQKIKQLGFNAGGGIGFKYYFVRNFGVAIDAGYEEASWLKVGFVFKTK